ncbi:MAG: hypothetical protein R6V85_19765 [Polyangia bacterium]
MKRSTIAALVLLLGCGQGGSPSAIGDGGTDADADADADGDSDADSDGDSDADSDADTDADSDGDSDADTDADTDSSTDTDSGTDTGPECLDNSTCQEDSHCVDGECVPWDPGSYDMDCTQLSIAGLFQPSIQCEWTGPADGDPYPNHTRVLSAPVVVDFDFDDDDSTIEPSIVFTSYDGDDGSSGYYEGAFGVIRVIDGQTCEPQYNVGTQLNGCNSPAIGDLDLDGRPEIVAHTGVGGLATYTYSSGDDSFQSFCSGTLTFGGESSGWSAPSIYDLDSDGSPEIMTGGVTYDASCNVLDQSLGLAGHMYSGAGYPVVADLDGELDSYGLPSVELPTGSELYRFDSASTSWLQVWSGAEWQGYIAVADFGTFTDDPAEDDRLTADGIAEIVTVRAPDVRITTMDGRLIYGPVAMPSGQGGGPPTVGDFDGDGLPEVSCSGSDSIAVFDMDCTGLPDMVTCSSLSTDGVLWWQPSQDHSSNRTGSSLFDFEGDGAVEVIYADEVFTRVYDGQTGAVLFSQWHSSCTWNEYPIVADVDGDFGAELVVPSNSNCDITPTTAGGLSYPTGPNGYPMDPLFRGLPCEDGGDCQSGVCDAGYCRCDTDDDCGGTGSGFVCAAPPGDTPGEGDTCRAEWREAYDGIRVYADVLDRWVASRTIWSQHAYSVTHVEEDGTVVPTDEWEQNWLDEEMNNFRQNVQGEADASSSPDATSGDGAFAECTDQGDAVLSADVCNRGTQPLGAGVPVAFYQVEVEPDNLIGVVETEAIIAPGDCETVGYEWDSPPDVSAAVDVIVVADDDGSGNGQNSECVEGNNTCTIPEVGCLNIPE